MSDKLLTTAAQPALAGEDTAESAPRPKSFKTQAADLLARIEQHQYTVELIGSKPHEKLHLVSKNDEAAVRRDVEAVHALYASKPSDDKSASQLVKTLMRAANTLTVIHEAHLFLAGMTKSPNATLEAFDKCSADALDQEPWRAQFIAHAAKTSLAHGEAALAAKWPDVRAAIAMAPSVKLASPYGKPPALDAKLDLSGSLDDEVAPRKTSKSKSSSSDAKKEKKKKDTKKK
jgi:hypothetical protein